MRIFIAIICFVLPNIGFAQSFTKVLDNPLSTLAGDSRSVNWVDVNNDSFIDCFISNGPSSGQNNSFFINDKNGSFTLLIDDPISNDSKPSDGATFADIDNDGDLDAFVVNWYNRHNMAYINDGSGHFTQIIDGQWVVDAGYSETASFGDYDNDGLVDLYVTNSDGISRNFLYRNEGELSFSKVEEGLMVTDQSASRNVSWSDVDGDGDLDLLITNESSQKEQFYRNDGGGVFEKLTNLEITSKSFSTMSSSWADIDNDGDLDLFLATNGPKNLLYRNDGNLEFTSLTDTDISTNGSRSFSSSWADIDNDGDLDLFVTNAFASGTRLKNNLYLNDGFGDFTEVLQGSVVTDDGWSYGCAFGDYDNDGFQDLVVATTRFDGTDEADYLYHNDGNDNNWVMFSLEGTVSNRSAIGAKVRVKANINNVPVWQMREVSAQSAYCSQNDMRTHFGLADAETIDSVIVEWPSGIVQYLTDLSANQILTVEEEFINSIGDHTERIQISVFPNPTDSNVHLSANFEQPVDDLHLEIVSASGKVVYSKTFQSARSEWQYELDFRKLNTPPGLYFLKINTGINDVVKKIVYQ